MASVKIKVKRETKGGALRPFVVIEDIQEEYARVVQFDQDGVAQMFVEAGRVYGLGVHCEGPRGAANTATVLQADVEIIPPLTASVRSDYGVDFASDRFTAAAR